MVQVLPVPALASSRVVPTLGSGSVMSKGVRLEAVTAAHLLGAGEQGLPDLPGVRREPGVEQHLERRVVAVGAPVVGVGVLALDAEGRCRGRSSRPCGRARRPRRPRPSARATCPSAQAAAVAIGTGSGARRPRSRSSTSVAQPLGGPVVERPGQRPPRPGPLAADGVGGEALVGSGRAQGEQVDPRQQPLARLEPRVAEGDQLGAVHAGDGARRAGVRPRGRRRRRGCATSPAPQVGGAGDQPLALLDDLGAGQSTPSRPGGRVPRSCSASITASASWPASSSRSRWSPMPHFSSASSSIGMASLTSSGASGCGHVEALAQEGAHRVGEERLEVGERHVDRRGPGRAAPVEERRAAAPARRPRRGPRPGRRRRS